MDTHEHERGIGRRDLIRRGAIVAGVAWTAPLIIESLASPAGALSPTGGYPCSYITVVYRVGTTYYASKFNGSSGTCAGNTTSGDIDMLQSCSGAWYDNDGSSNAIRRSTDGVTFTTLASAPSGGSCESYLAYAGGTTISAIGGATIVFALAHDGSYPGKNAYICPAGPQPNNSITAPSCG